MSSVTTNTQPSDGFGEINSRAMQIWNILAKMGTVTVCKVVSCTNDGALTKVGFVDLQPLVNQVDGSGKPIPHGVIHNCPYFRMQGGQNAIILDPQVDDIGIVLFADRDLTGVIKTGAQANPGSARMFSMADGLYIGGVLNGVPNQFVEFSSTGIRISSQQQVELDAPDVAINCNTFELNANNSATITSPEVTIDASTSMSITSPTTTVNGALVVNGATTMNGGVSQTGGGTSTFSGAITATGNVTGGGKSLDSHVHSGVTGGSSDTGPPV